MPTITNDIDVALQASATRFPPPDDRVLLLQCSAPGGFKVAIDGTPTPAAINFNPIPLGMAGASVSYNVTGGLALTLSGNDAILNFVDMSAASGTVTAYTTYEGILYSSIPVTINKISDGSGGNGSDGAPGQRGAGRYFVAGSSWSDLAADLATPGDTVLDDVVTISNGTNFVDERRWNGSAWVHNAVVIDGNAIIPGTLTASQINTNGLTVRAPDGTVLLDVGGLRPGYEAPGTKNSDLTPAITEAQAAADAAARADRGAYVNIDPNFRLASQWEIYRNESFAPVNFNFTTTAPGAESDSCVYPGNLAGAGLAAVWLLEKKVYPINPALVYEIAAKFFADAGNNRTAHLGICFYNAAGDQLAVAWGSSGEWSAYPWIGAPTAGAFGRESGTFGAGTGRDIPASAVKCRIGVVLNQGGSSNTRMGAQRLTLSEYVENGATKNVVTSGATAPASPANGDIWVDTNAPVTIKTRVAGAWVVGGNVPTSLSHVDAAASTKLGGVAVGATSNTVSTGTLAARPTGANGDFYYATDTSTLYQKVGGAWVASGTVGAPPGTNVGSTPAETVEARANGAIPKGSGMTVSVTGGSLISGSSATGTERTYGTKYVSVGGTFTAPLTYSWVLASYTSANGYTDSRGYLSGALDTSGITIGGYAGNDENTVSALCTVRDASGLTAQVYVYAQWTHGSGAA